MTRRAIYRALLSAPRDHADQGRIGHRVIYAKPDGREKVTHVFRVLRTALRRTA